MKLKYINLFKVILIFMKTISHKVVNDIFITILYIYIYLMPIIEFLTFIQMLFEKIV